MLIEGVPGLGKTLLVRALAKTFNGSFRRIQFTPDLMPADVCGHTLYDPATGQFTTRRGPVFTHLLLADEINRAPAKTQAALLEVMQEGQVTIEGDSEPLAPPFMVLATQNPIEHEGTYALPEAQLDRFLLKIRIGYPTLEEERRLARQVTDAVGRRHAERRAGARRSSSPRPCSRSSAWRRRSRSTTRCSTTRCASCARRAPGAASRRARARAAAIALIRAARAAALIEGRDHVTPDDVKRMAPPCLRHRVTPAPELEIEGHDADSILTALLEKVDAPRA